MEIRKEFYYVKYKNSELLFHNEQSVFDWLLSNRSILKDVKVFIINTEKWTVTEMPDKWWIGVVAEDIRRQKNEKR